MSLCRGLQVSSSLHDVVLEGTQHVLHGHHIAGLKATYFFSCDNCLRTPDIQPALAGMARQVKPDY